MASLATDHWDDDLLGRKQDAEFLYNFLIGQVEKRNKQNRTSSYVINLDADWGGGKSFFLRRFGQDIEAHGHLVVRINAWQDDHTQDPYIAIMAAIDRTLSPYIERPGKLQNAWNATKARGGAIALRTSGVIAKGLLKKISGISIDEIADSITDNETVADLIEDGTKVAGSELEKLFDSSLEALIKGFSHADSAITGFKGNLAQVLESLPSGKKTPLFLIVDELDRCRPTYAVQLLERVKHLFDVSNVVFVFGTNSGQLQHSIAGAYGHGFDGYRYLKRFFDRTYAFEKPTTRAFIESLCADLPKEKIRTPDNNLAEVLTLGCDAYDFDLRAIGQIMEMIDAAATAWPHKLPIEIALLFPLCAHFYQTGKVEWPRASDEILKKWQLKKEKIRNFNNETIDVSIYFKDAYNISLIYMDNLSETSKITSYDKTTEYVRSLFSPEWNGIAISENQKSIQSELLGIIGNAGKLKRNPVTDIGR